MTIRKTKRRPELGNLLLVAPTRSGKSLLAVSQLLTWQHSVIVNDIKGELFTQTAGFRSLLGPIYVLDPTGVGHAYDPLHGKTSEDAFLSSATQLTHRVEREDIFTQRATKMLARIFAAAKRRKVAALPYTRLLLRMGLRGCVEQLQAISPELATSFLDEQPEHANLNDRYLQSSWSSLTTIMEPFLTETVIRSLAHSNFTSEIITSPRPVTVYLRWREQDLLTLTPLIRLLWGTLIDEMISVYDLRAGTGCQLVLLLMDEGGRTAIPSLAHQATIVAGRGISLWLAVQSLSQLEDVYGKVRAQVLRDNKETQLYYRPTDLATARYLEDRLGRRSAYAHAHTTTEQHGSKTSESQSEQAISLLTAQDVLRLRDDEVIDFHRALPPIEHRRMDWRDYPLLQKRRSISAPELPTLAPIADVPTLHGLGSPHYVSPD